MRVKRINTQISPNSSTWAFCGIYAGLLALVVWSGPSVFVAEPVGLAVTAAAC